ncbi:TATA box-binding protein-associated factor RNA polymerase I subunit C [Leuresthes tenuis]|uniref:TATA box-binding protein-associated factor RNA polymerase I subunit C n=1 Tax=Leuresthes tenuis TaxID=355514 RepID=UPI003B511F24
MDYQFPHQLFPSFYDHGPPDLVLKHSAGSWGCYDSVTPQGGPGPLSSWKIMSRHEARGETWCHTEPVPVPLLSPKTAFLGHLQPPDPLDATKHLQNFFTDHCQDAFGSMSDILGENFNFQFGKRKERHRQDSVSMWRIKNHLDVLKLNVCQQVYRSTTMTRYCSLLSSVVPDIPTELLSSLLYKELQEQRDRVQFCEAATGGALAFVPFSEGGGSTSQHGCLLYPGGQGLDRLYFHKVALQQHSRTSSCVEASSSDPVSFQLKAPVRQISCSALFDDCCVAVRSDHFCGVWRFSERREPRLLQVINSGEVTTCVSVSPHVLGEVLVASESGAANLWTVGKGMQKVRLEHSNLYFNAKSPWRWCEFSAHPRVMLYADRTGVELTDMRVSPCSGHTLFRISSSSECRRGERLILTRYLGDIHAFHHLVTTQYSAYIMDERFPCVPMLKCDHMMQSPPVFAHMIPGSDAAAGETRTDKVLLGSHRSQEVTLLQYSGGRLQPCFSRGPPQALLTPKGSLKHLPVQIPHRLDTTTNRLSAPAAGVTCIQRKAGRGASSGESMCILQLTEAGDIFYQILEHKLPDRDTSGGPAAENQRAKKLFVQRKAAEQPPPEAQLVASDTPGCEDAIGPTQEATIGVETPEKEQPRLSRSAVSSSAGSEAESRRRLDAGMKDGDVAADECRSQQQTAVKLSKNTSAAWKRWLQILIRKSSEKKPRSLQHFTIRSKGLLRLSHRDERAASEEESVENLRRALKSCMSKRSLLVNGAASAGAAGVEPVPHPVDTDAWTDPLSQRLTLSWQGEKAWLEWWEEQLGLNHQSKLEDLRRRRRRQKEAKRAAGQRLELSGSFTSSVSYQSALDDFSSSTGWSSATSQGAWSDTDGGGVLSQLESSLKHENRRTATPSTVQSDSPAPSPASTPRTYKRSEPQTPNGRHTLPPSQAQSPGATTASQRRTKRPAEDHLGSLFTAQEDPAQTDPPHSPAAASSSGLRSSQSVLVKTPRGALSTVRGFSQTLSPSLGSQARPGPSQSSQPKKKSRMGF